jgi:hypothetical protein
MQTNGLKHILRRVRTWTPAAQQEALQSLRAIEQDFTKPDYPELPAHVLPLEPLEGEFDF